MRFDTLYGNDMELNVLYAHCRLFYCAAIKRCNLQVTSIEFVNRYRDRIHRVRKRRVEVLRCFAATSKSVSIVITASHFHMLAEPRSVNTTFFRTLLARSLWNWSRFINAHCNVLPRHAASRSPDSFIPASRSPGTGFTALARAHVMRLQTEMCSCIGLKITRFWSSIWLYKKNDIKHTQQLTRTVPVFTLRWVILITVKWLNWKRLRIRGTEFFHKVIDRILIINWKL